MTAAPGPDRDRPRLRGYGIPDDEAGMLPWSHARARLEQAGSYWLATAGPDGHGHAVPLWGVWLDDAFYYDGAPYTRHNRNVAANPWASLHLESADDVVIVEGPVTPLAAPERPLAERLAAAYRAKYADRGYSPGPDMWDDGGLYRLDPSRAFSWTSYPTDVTRFRFPATR